MKSKEEQFKALVNAQQERMLSVCRYFSKDRQSQQDLYQEILVNTWKGLDHFRGDAQPGTWMYRIAVNTALGFAGREKRRLQFSLSLDPAALAPLTGEDDGIDFRRKEALLGEMENCINQLSVIDKVLVTLMLEELSCREMADIVGITEPNVRVKIHRIKEILKNNMGGKSNENNE